MYIRHKAGEMYKQVQKCLLCGEVLQDIRGAMYHGSNPQPLKGFPEGDLFVEKQGYRTVFMTNLPEGAEVKDCNSLILPVEHGNIDPEILKLSLPQKDLPVMEKFDIDSIIGVAGVSVEDGKVMADIKLSEAPTLQILTRIPPDSLTCGISGYATKDSNGKIIKFTLHSVSILPKPSK